MVEEASHAIQPTFITYLRARPLSKFSVKCLIEKNDIDTKAKKVKN